MINLEFLLTTFEASIIFDAAGAVAKIGLAQYQTTLGKFNQVKLVQICQTVHTSWFSMHKLKFYRPFILNVSSSFF